MKDMKNKFRKATYYPKQFLRKKVIFLNKRNTVSQKELLTK